MVPVVVRVVQMLLLKVGKVVLLPHKRLCGKLIVILLAETFKYLLVVLDQMV